MVDANLRYVVLEEDSLYRLRRKSGSLCDHCGIRNSCNAHSNSVKTCSTYMPVIKFFDMKGTDKPFNTMRLRSAWFKRVIKGQTVALVDKDNQVAGTALVTGKHVDTKENVLHSYYKENHMKPESPDEMEKILRRCNGNLFVNLAEEITVIELEPNYDQDRKRTG